MMLLYINASIYVSLVSLKFLIHSKKSLHHFSLVNEIELFLMIKYKALLFEIKYIYILIIFKGKT